MSIHSTIVNLIRTKAEAVNTLGQFIYGDDIFQTINYPNESEQAATAKPLISLLPFTYILRTGESSNYNSGSLNMLFTRSADPTDTAVRHEAIVNEMSTLAEAFITELNDTPSPVNYVISDVSFEGQKQIYAGTVSGCIVSFTINVQKVC